MEVKWDCYSQRMSLSRAQTRLCEHLLKLGVQQDSQEHSEACRASSEAPGPQTQLYLFRALGMKGLKREPMQVVDTVTLGRSTIRVPSLSGRG